MSPEYQRTAPTWVIFGRPPGRPSPICACSSSWTMDLIERYRLSSKKRLHYLSHIGRVFASAASPMIVAFERIAADTDPGNR
jgi:hypothetical protein